MTGHSSTADASVVWMNSAETYVGVEAVDNSFTANQGMEGFFITVGGKFEFFIFGSAQGPKVNQNTLSELTGYPVLPPIHSLGYHYCKYEKNSAELMI